MYRLDREEFVRPPYMYLWGVMGFQAGFLNAFGFLACGRYVSHVTGFGTQIGVAMAQNMPLVAIELLGFPLFFIFGSFVNGYFTAAPIENHRKPHFNVVTGLLCGLIFLLMVLGGLEVFGHFSKIIVETPDFILLFLLSFICGMQNGCFAVLTKGSIRTTHLTGISTDIGTDFARLWLSDLSRVERFLTQKTNTCRLLTFLAFSVGSVASVIASQAWEYMALIVPLCTSLGAFVAVHFINLAMDKKFANK